MATTKTFKVLPQESAPYNRLLELLPVTDLTETTAATGQEFRVTIPAGSRIRDVVAIISPVGDASVAAFDDVTLTVGDSSSAVAFIGSQQIAKLAATPIKIAGMNKADAVTLTSTNGTAAGASASLANLAAEAEKIGDDVRALHAVSALGKIYTSADYLKVVVTPESGKSLSDLDQGAIRIFVELQSFDKLIG